MIESSNYYYHFPDVLEDRIDFHHNHPKFNEIIGKTGNRYLRRILIQVAHAAVRTKGSVLGRFYRRVLRRRGSPIAIVATARKDSCDHPPSMDKHGTLRGTGV